MTGILSIQFNPKIGDKEFNLIKVEEFISQNSDKNLDLVLFSEFFSKLFLELAVIFKRIKTQNYQ